MAKAETKAQREARIIRHERTLRQRAQKERKAARRAEREAARGAA